MLISRALVCCLLLLLAPRTWAQDPAPAREGPPLFLIDKSTQIDRLSFTFEGSETFSESELVEGALLATTEPTFFDRLWSVFPWVSLERATLVPIEVQKDVARLRDFYRQRGFPQAHIDYSGSTLDTAANRIHIIFDVDEGPPTNVRSLRYQNEGGMTLDSLFNTAVEGAQLADRWARFRTELPTKPGERFSTFDFSVTKGQVLDFARDRGFAFASISSDSTVSSDQRLIDLTVTVETGPRTVVDTVQVRGNGAVEDRVARREVPLQRGDLFNQGRLIDGQRNLFALPIFRVAVGLVPDQPVDSTVTIRYEVREADLRLFRAQTGYSREEGIVLQPSIEHRNFMGGARSLALAAEWRTTFLASTAGDFKPVRRLDVQATLTQPFVYRRDLSAIVSPFYRFEDNDNLGIGYREVGVNSTLIYEIMPFRTANLRYTFAVTKPLSVRDVASRNAFNRSILGGSATLGKVDDFFQPTDGTLYRPGFELAAGLLGSGVEYAKAELNVAHYRPLSRKVQGGVRVYGGYIKPFGTSSDQFDPVTEYRFDLIRFYAGGSSDVRGWGLQQLGPKLILADTVALPAGPTIIGQPQPTNVQGFQYEPVGGTTKVAANVEIRTPFPGLSENWRAAFFVDGAYINAAEGGRGLYQSSQLRIGTGAGIRYLTPIGFLRLDVGYKVNPAESDVYSAEDLYRRRFEGADTNPSTWRRFALHLSIGQAF